ncbi:galactoside O-acetyltransferase [Niveomyces insectorum RCEF 264]|uniref:Galactoside O-acetyltransferase n=1 Tax=Niveomyces insectorum RCEF 264 TaxID=1081102 RepID=A0A167RHI1_9HYPO|nr:galactoside O-acetyltransferase [Niveomyces insectorum RCEF 264]
MATSIPTTPEGLAENRRRMERGELYYAFTPDLVAERRQCAAASLAFNNASPLSSRRELVELWNKITRDETPLPPPAETPEADEAQLADHPWVESPVRMDYGYNVRLGTNVYVNAHSTWIDTRPITVGARTLIGPNCAFYSGTHPLDPQLRNGTKGPEAGQPIVIGADCWLGGNVIVLPGVTIGDGVTVGAGSVVTKDVPPRVCVVGNPARVLKPV